MRDKSLHNLASVPTGAWDFPLSRNEKVRRLYLVFEAEIDMAREHVDILEQENGALRSMLPQQTDMALQKAVMSAQEAIAQISNLCSQNPPPFVSASPGMYKDNLSTCCANNSASPDAGCIPSGETPHKIVQEICVTRNVAGEAFLDDMQKVHPRTSRDSVDVMETDPVHVVPESSVACCIDTTKEPEPCEFNHRVFPSTPTHQTTVDCSKTPEINSPNHASPQINVTDGQPVKARESRERPSRWMAALGSLKVAGGDSTPGTPLGYTPRESIETPLRTNVQLSCHENSVESTPVMVKGQVTVEAIPVESTHRMADRDHCVAVEEDTNFISCNIPDPNDVAAWRQAVEALEPCQDDNETELWQLRKLMTLCDETEKFEFVEHDNRPVLVTAPHSIYLIRDGEQPHLVEEYSADIATAIAEELGGTNLSWTCMEQRRARLLWSLAKRREYSLGALLDPRNRDPNYLSTSELLSNPWCKDVIALASMWRDQFQHGQEPAMLHIDIHGSQNPPKSPAHITVGLGAMCVQARKQGIMAIAQTDAFGVALKSELTSAIEGFGLPRNHELVRIVTAEEEGETKARFSGALPARTGRHTQTQQAIAYAGFTHAVQLELSKQVRRLLVGNSSAAKRLANALRVAWARAKRKVPIASTGRRSGSVERMIT